MCMNLIATTFPPVSLYFVGASIFKCCKDVQPKKSLEYWQEKRLKGNERVTPLLLLEVWITLKISN